MRKVRIAQIGTSRHSHGRMVMESLCRQSDLFEVAGVCFPEGEEERLSDRLAAFNGLPRLSLQEVLEDPSIEAVAVETEERYLTKYALLAAKAGKQIHMEKPGGYDLAAFEELIRTVQNSGVILHLGYMYRYNPVVQQLMQEVREGALGEIYAVEAQMNCLQSDEAREMLRDLPGGMMFFLGCHLLDLILQLQGIPQRVIPMNKGSDFGFALLEYPKGISFAKTTSIEWGGYARRQLVVCGSKKTVELKPFEIDHKNSHVSTVKTEYTAPSWRDRGNSSETAPFQRYDGMLRAFGAMVLGEKENPFTPEYELELYKTLAECCGGLR